MTVARFSEDMDEWPVTGWSMVLEFEPDRAGQVPMSTVASFLVADQGPTDRLSKGTVFELLEGSRVVASVHVLEPAH